MARVQIIENGGWYDGVQIIGDSPDYPDSTEDDWDLEPNFEEREWLHRHGIVIDEECSELEDYRWR